MIVWAMAAAVLPAGAVYAAVAAPGADSPAVEITEPSAVPEPLPAPAPADRPESAPLAVKSLDLNYRPNAPAPEPRTDDLRFDFAERLAPSTGLKLASSSGASQTGWAFSGQAGPLRWLTPLDSEGQTRLRLGGRLPDQPRTPGLGRFNLSIHYSFE
ncbi:MAG: hypothetical protein ACRET3_02110 [Burkholderiales bacterium]